MERFHFVRDNEVIRLPPGFRFQPTDEELVFQYLKCKIFSCPLPTAIIPEINICNYDPWDLPGNVEQERYFFCNNEAKYRNGNRINRTTASGYWKATGNSSNQMENWVICRIFLKKRNTREDAADNGVVGQRDFMMRDNIRLGLEISSCSSSSSSSVITLV
uniref:NAC transcription factor 37 n=1 Tax=Litchi chinensis TaxID=151069 RepID=A0A8K1MBG0_LITCN|nr:NAC transcription factor 37 [Litchi chinensis]